MPTLPAKPTNPGRRNLSAGRALPAGPTPGSDPLNLPHCPICGDGLLSDIWLCAICQTPHHGECARYFGGCAIFGCRERAAPTRLEEATWPRAVGRLRSFTVVRQLEVPTLTACLLGPPVLLLGCGLSVLLPFHGAMLAMLGLGMLVFPGVFYILLERVASFLWWRLRGELGQKNSALVPIPRSRLDHVIPRLGTQTVLHTFLTALGSVFVVVALAFGLMAGLNGGGAAGFVAVVFFFGYVAAMLLVGSRQLQLHRQQLEVTIHRFTATFAPLPAKASKSES